MLPDRADRIQMLIDIADRFRKIPAEIAVPPYDESRRVPGCESEAFVWAVPRGDGAYEYEFDVLNPQGVSAKAMAAILKDTLSGEKPEIVAKLPEEVVYQIFGNELSMGKTMGLTGMVRMVKQLTK